MNYQREVTFLKQYALRGQRVLSILNRIQSGILCENEWKVQSIVKNDCVVLVAIVGDNGTNLSVFSESLSATQQLFDSNFIDWSSHVVIHALPPQLSSCLPSHADLGAPCHAFVHSGDDHLEVLKPPDGFRVNELTADDHTNTVVGHWKFRSENSFARVRRCIEHYTCKGVFCNDELVAWCVQQDDSTMGMLHVLEGYRGRGLAKVLISEFIQAVDPAWCYIEHTNETSFRLFTSMGFIKAHGADWYHIRPPSD